MITWEQKLIKVLSKGTIKDVTPEKGNSDAIIPLTSTPEENADYIARGFRLYHFKAKPEHHDSTDFDSLLQWNQSIRRFVHLIYSAL